MFLTPKFPPPTEDRVPLPLAAVKKKRAAEIKAGEAAALAAFPVKGKQERKQERRPDRTY